MGCRGHEGSKVLLRAMVRVSIRIRVSAFKTSPASLSIPARAHLSQTLNFQFDLPFHWKLESWIISQLTVFRSGSAEPDLERYLNKTWTASAHVPTVGSAWLGNGLLFTLVWRADSDHRDRYLKAMPTTTHLGILCVVWQVSSSVRWARLTPLQPQTPKCEMVPW